MAMSSDEKNSLDLDRAHIELNDDERTASSPLIISLSDVGEDEPDRNESSHVPSRITFCDRLPKYKSCAEHPTSPVLPAATRDQSMLPLTGLKQLPNTTSILLYGLVRCIITWFLIAGFYLSFWWYKNKVISPGEKTMFDAVNVVLSIAFGLNIASSLKEIALYFRWWILDYRRRPSQEVKSLCPIL